MPNFYCGRCGRSVAPNSPVLCTAGLNLYCRSETPGERMTRLAASQAERRASDVIHQRKGRKRRD